MLAINQCQVSRGSRSNSYIKFISTYSYVFIGTAIQSQRIQYNQILSQRFVNFYCHSTSLFIENRNKFYIKFYQRKRVSQTKITLEFIIPDQLQLFESNQTRVVGTKLVGTKCIGIKLFVPPLWIYIQSDAQLSPPSFGIFKSVC